MPWVSWGWGLAKPLLKEAVFPLIVASLIFAFGMMKYRQGYREASDFYKAKIAQEVARQEKAKHEAELRAWDLTRQIEIAKELLDEQTKRSALEASRDPNAGRIGLGVDSVRRLNRVTE